MTTTTMSGRRRKPRPGDIYEWINIGNQVHVAMRAGSPVIVPTVTQWLILKVDGEDVVALCVDEPGYVPRAFTCSSDFMGRSQFARGWTLLSSATQP